MTEQDKNITHILQQLKNKFGVNRNYSTKDIHFYIDDIIRRYV